MEWSVKEIIHISACRFAIVFRFIDDLSNINDRREFERSWKKIYPPELEHKKKNRVYSEDF